MSSLVCRVPQCGGVLDVLLETGEHPVSNGYIREGETAPRKPLSLSRCSSCGLLQLPDTFTEAELAAAVPSWVRYNEPEAHLDEVALLLAGLMQDDTSRSVAGLTYIDQSLQDRLKRAGWESQSGLDVLNGADSIERCSIESMLAGVQSRRWGHEGHKVDLLLARHVFDHTRDMETFFQFVRSGLSSRGLVLFEVPSSVLDVEGCNPLMLWESHANYFSPSTFLQTLEDGGFKIECFREFPLSGPSALVAICSVGASATSSACGKVDVSAADLLCFQDHFSRCHELLRNKMRVLRSEFSVIALLGAGHIGNLFLNLHSLAEFVDFAVDDDSRKSGLRLPGSGLMIQTGSSLVGTSKLLILLAVNPSSEDRTIARLQPLHPTARFASIFGSSNNYILA